MNKIYNVIFLLIFITISSCTVVQPTYQPTYEKSASSYTAKEKMEYLDTHGIIEFRKKFGH
jgi:hypothetical protein